MRAFFYDFEMIIMIMNDYFSLISAAFLKHEHYSLNADKAIRITTYVIST